MILTSVYTQALESLVMTNELIHDQHAHQRLTELGVPNRVERDSRWTEHLQIPASRDTAETLGWLSTEAGARSDLLAGAILEKALIRADLTVAARIQCAKRAPEATPAYYSQLIGALRHGYDESRLAACTSQLGVDDWRAIINDIANPGHQAIDTLKEMAGFVDRGNFVAKLIEMASASPDILSAIREQISQQRESVKFLDGVERAIT